MLIKIWGFFLLSVILVITSVTEFNKSGGPAGLQVRMLWGPVEIYSVPVRMSDTIFLQY